MEWYIFSTLPDPPPSPLPKIVETNFGEQKNKSNFFLKIAFYPQKIESNITIFFKKKSSL